MQNHNLIKTEYLRWHENGQAKKFSSSACIACLEKTSEYIMSRNICEAGIWAIKSARHFNDVRNKLLRDKDFKMFDKRNYKFFEKICGIYYNFLRETGLLLKDLRLPLNTKIGNNGSLDLTIAEAAAEVLKQKQPLTVKQIYQIILEQNLYSFKAATPISVLACEIRTRCLGVDMPSRLGQYPNKIFKVVANSNGGNEHLYALIDYEDRAQEAQPKADKKRMKKCPHCELNYITEEDSLCAMCKSISETNPNLVLDKKEASESADEREIVFDWSENGKLYGFKPYTLRFLELCTSPIITKSWKQVFVSICEHIIMRYPKVNLLECNNLYKGSRLLCSFNSEELFSSHKLTNGLYVETNHSSNRLMKISKLFLQFCGADLNNIEVIYISEKGRLLEDKDKPVLCENNNELMERIIEFVRLKRFKGVGLDEIVDGVQDKRARVLRAIEATNDIIEIDYGHYIYHNEFVDLDKAREIMLTILQGYFARFNGVATSKILYEAVKVRLEIFLNDNDLDDETKVYLLAKHFFAKSETEKYIFYSNYFIWEKEPEYPKSIQGLLINLAKRNDGFFTKAEATDYLSQLKLSDNIRQAMGFFGSRRNFVLYAEDEYLYFPFAGIDSDGIDKIKNSLMHYFNDISEEFFIVLREVHNDWLSSLPPLPHGKPWTHLLLQEIIRQHPETGLETVYSGLKQDIDILHAAIVRKRDKISFADIVWDFLSKHYELPREFGADELRLAIRDVGMIAGNELIYNMHKALNERRFVWKNNNAQVLVLALQR